MEVMMDQQREIYIWTCRIVYITAALFTSVILIRDIKLRNQERINKNESHILRNKWLDLWSFLTLFTSVIVVLLHLSRQVPYLCEYTFSLSYSMMGTQKVLFTYYQIARLKYCFSSDSIHSTKYGYPQYLFYILYIFGGILSIGYIISFWLIFEPHKSEMEGCVLDTSPVWSIDTLIFIINYVFYFLWDWTVLFLYLYKISQLNSHQIKKQNSRKFSQEVNNRILFILSKIVFMTIIYEVLAVFDIIPHFIGLLWMNIRWYNIFSFSFDSMLGSIVMLLMMERYNSWYLKLVSMMDKCRIFCCCTRFVEKYILSQPEKLGHVQSLSNSTNINTTHKTKSSDIIGTANSNIFNGSTTSNDQDQVQDEEESIDTKTVAPVLDRHKSFEDCEKEYTVNVDIELE